MSKKKNADTKKIDGDYKPKGVFADFTPETRSKVVETIGADVHPAIVGYMLTAPIKAEGGKIASPSVNDIMTRALYFRDLRDQNERKDADWVKGINNTVSEAFKGVDTSRWGNGFAIEDAFYDFSDGNLNEIAASVEESLDENTEEGDKEAKGMNTMLDALNFAAEILRPMTAV